MQQQVFNRIDNNVINWSYVESVTIETDRIIIYYTSGNYKEITDPKTIKNLIDMFSIFPDINNDEIREAMKIATINQNPVKTSKQTNNIKTDIQ